MSYNKSEPANSDLLTNEILSKQIAVMPISDIRILDEGEELARHRPCRRMATLGSWLDLGPFESPPGEAVTGGSA